MSLETIMDNHHFNIKKLSPLKDTPERLGYKEYQNVMYLNKEGLIQVGFVFMGEDGQGRNVLKFPANATHIFTNVTVIG